MKIGKYILLALLIVSLISVGGKLAGPVHTWDDTIYATNNRYRIGIDGEGRYYLYIPFVTSDPDYDGKYHTVDDNRKWYSFFSSTADMVSAIKSGQVCLDGIEKLSEETLLPTGRLVYIQDLDSLYEPIIPEVFTYNRIVWRGAHYTIYFEDKEENFNWGGLEWENSMTIHYGEAYTPPEVSRYDRTESVDYRNATAYYYTNKHDNKEFTNVSLYYELHSGNRTVYVKELYPLESYEKGYRPQCIYLYESLENLDAYYAIELYDCGNDYRTEEFLLSFGLVPYVEAEA